MIALGLALTLSAAAPAAQLPVATQAWAGPKSATATAERTNVRLGEPFNVTVEIRHPKGERWSLAEGVKLEPFALRAQSPSTQPSGADEITRLQLELSLFKLGAHAVPDLALVAETQGSPPHAFSLPGPMITGVAGKGKDKERRDIRGPVPFSVTSFKPLLYVLGALIALALAFLAFHYWKNRPRPEPVARLPVIPEDRVALEALALLEAEGLPTSGRFKAFHLRLSEILRGYLSARYGLLAMDMTSEELYRALARLPSEGLSLADLQWVCQQGDLAKFAKGAPSVDDCKQALQIVRKLVQLTRRRTIEDALPQGPGASPARRPAA